MPPKKRKTILSVAYYILALKHFHSQILEIKPNSSLIARTSLSTDMRLDIRLLSVAADILSREKPFHKWIYQQKFNIDVKAGHIMLMHKDNNLYGNFARDYWATALGYTVFRFCCMRLIIEINRFQSL